MATWRSKGPRVLSRVLSDQRPTVLSLPPPGSGTDPVLVNVAFVNNSAGINAGGLSVKGQAAPRLEACTFDA
eukprot:8325901-Pyramimonas_sp.AAC.1